MIRVMLLVAAATVCFDQAAVAIAQDGGGAPDYDFQWATIGDPGNRPTRPDEFRFHEPSEMGAVAYEYRMAVTEVTIGQWFEFVQAYAPYYEGSNFNAAFTSNGIIHIAGQYLLNADPRRPANMSYEYAARYCNWLHNGKALTRDAFESGVYDTSTFTTNPDGTHNHQLSHQPGARFWIPTDDEWVKAAYWDPHKNGPNDGGYWYYPSMSDTELFAALPPDGGMTNAGPGLPALPVGSYPHARSYWGLLDTSGGVKEHVDIELAFPSNSTGSRGSRAGDALAFINDAIEYGGGGFSWTASSGLRLASAVPSPSVLPILVTGVFFTHRRRHQFAPLRAIP